MHQSINWPEDKHELYQLLTAQMASLAEGCPPISVLSNAAALLYSEMVETSVAISIAAAKPYKIFIA